jgi:hypothetical protein
MDGLCNLTCPPGSLNATPLRLHWNFLILSCGSPMKAPLVQKISRIANLGLASD